MGWWKMNKNGGIDWSHSETSGRSLANALPGKDTVENFYNGDGPADIMGDAIDSVIDRAIISGTVVTEQDITDLFLREKVNFCQGQEKQLLGIVRRAWNDIAMEWNEAWKRDPVAEEKEGVVKFCCGGLFK